MKDDAAILALAALAQPTRLAVVRLLAKHEPEGLAAGELARALVVLKNTMSTHLAILSRAGLIVGERRGVVVNYRAEPSRLRELVLFLAEDCAGERSGPLADSLVDLASRRAKDVVLRD